MTRQWAVGLLAVLLLIGSFAGGWFLSQQWQKDGMMPGSGDTDTRELKQTIQSLEKKLAQKTKQISRLNEENQNIVEELRRELKQARARIENRAVRLTLPETILFDQGSAWIHPEGQRTLKTVRRTLQNYPDRNILVEGHADTFPIHTPRYESNWELSADRAVEVLKYLVYAQGIKKDRIGAAGYGPFRPIVPNNSPEHRARNRRVEIILLPPDIVYDNLSNDT